MTASSECKMSELVRIKTAIGTIAMFGACCANPGKPQSTSNKQPPTAQRISLSEHPCSPRLLEGDAGLQTVLQAQRLLVAGKNREVHTLLAAHTFRDRALGEQALIIKSSAAFRIHFEDPLKRVQFVELHVSWLEFEFAKKNDPLIAARLAEGYAVYQDTQGKAKTLLEDLVIHNSMPDAFAFATLAQLRAKSGESIAAGDALRQCNKIAERKAICTLNP